MSKLSLFKKSKKQDVVFASQVIRPEELIERNKFDVLFGEMTLDLSHLEMGNEPATIAIDAVFASVKVLLPPDLPIRIKTEVVFGSVKEPDGYELSFGERSVEQTDFFDQKALLTLKVSAVFASVQIIQGAMPLRNKEIPILQVQGQ